MLLANAKTVFADGDVIFREGDRCDHTFEVLSGAVDLLKQKDGKYARRGTLESGDVYGEGEVPFNLTLRAKGRTVLRQTDRAPNADTPDSPVGTPHPTLQRREGWIISLLRRLAGPEHSSPTVAQNSKHAPNIVPKTYSDPGFIRRLISGFSTDSDRIGVRVALLSGDTTKQHTRRLISALGNNKFLQTKGFKSPIKFDPAGDIAAQHERIATAARRWLFLQGADVLIWGQVQPSGSVMQLHFVTLANWDQQAPGAFDLETSLSLPIDFAPEFADLLRAVTLAAALPQSSAVKQLRQNALKDILEPGAAALNIVPQTMTNREQASIHLCFANVLAAASRPGYRPNLLAQAQISYRAVLSILSEHDAPYDWAYAQKHLGSILQIEGERTLDRDMLDGAFSALSAAERIFSIDRHPRAWAIVHNRLGLIRYRQGFDSDDTKILRLSLKHFTSALRVFSKDNAPQRWAEIMSNFAQAAQVLGGHSKSLEALATAANACRAVLGVRSRKKTPLAWAASQNNLGSALFLLGKQSRIPSRLQFSIDAFEQALIVYQNAGSDDLAAVAEKNMTRAQSVLDQLVPRNLPALEWEDQPNELDGGDSDDKLIRLPEPGEGLVNNDPLPAPGEGLVHDVEPAWLRQAV